MYLESDGDKYFDTPKFYCISKILLVSFLHIRLSFEKQVFFSKIGK